MRAVALAQAFLGCAQRNSGRNRTAGRRVAARQVRHQFTAFL